MHLADRPFDGRIACLDRLHEHAILLAALDLSLPGIDAVYPGDLRAGSQLGIDQGMGHGARFFLGADSVTTAMAVIGASLEDREVFALFPVGHFHGEAVDLGLLQGHEIIDEKVAEPRSQYLVISERCQGLVE